VLDVAGAELLGRLVLEVHEAHHAHLSGPARVRQVDVGQRHEHVQVLGVRQEVDEAEHQHGVRPPADVAHRVRRPGRDRVAEHRRQADRHQASVAGRRGRIGDRLHRAGEDQRRHQDRDHREDHDRLDRLDAVALQPLRLHHHAPVDQEADGRQDEQREQLLRQGVEPVQRRRQEVGVAEPVPDALHEDLDRAERDDEEAPEHGGVRRARDRVAQDLGLREADRQQVPEALRGPVETVLRFPDDRHVAVQPLGVVREEGRGQQQDDEEHDVPGRHGRNSERVRGRKTSGRRVSRAARVPSYCAAFAARTACVSAGTTSKTSPTMP
jgi:hypothetical protein